LVGRRAARRRSRDQSAARVVAELLPSRLDHPVGGVVSIPDDAAAVLDAETVAALDVSVSRGPIGTRFLRELADRIVLKPRRASLVILILSQVSGQVVAVRPSSDDRSVALRIGDLRHPVVRSILPAARDSVRVSEAAQPRLLVEVQTEALTVRKDDRRQP